MTKDSMNNMSGGGVVVATTKLVVASPAAPKTSTSNKNSNTLKHSLRSAIVANQKEVLMLEDAVLVRAEENIMHDEEITSVESNDDPNNLHCMDDEDDLDDEEENDVDQAILTVSLLSSMEHTNKSNKDDVVVDDAGNFSSGGNDDGDDLPKRRLRKRRRAGQDLERLEHFQSSREGGLARQQQPRNPAIVVVPSAKKNVRIKDQRNLTARLLRSVPTGPMRSRLPSISERVPNPLSKFDSHIASSNEITISQTSAKATFEDSDTNFMPIFSDEPASVSVETPTPIDIARKVNFSETSSSSSSLMNNRMRGLSIDLDLGIAEVGLEFPDDSSASMGGNNSDLHSVGGGGSGRNRAFSFECFAFGINADEPLPPLEQSTSNGLMMLGNNNTSTGNGSSVYHVELTMGRPRGDSIIFDPVSFQDGGILEQHALERSSVTTVPVPTAKTKKPTPIPVPKPKPVCAPPSPLLVVSSPISVLKTSTSHPARSTMSFAQQQSGDLPTISADGSLTLSLELLNKDGRIGIYLPEARRARIARFHAKRSKRIWRKRIKYDCRKKLADSRPRIKGRFVKRSDMDDDF